MGQFVQSTALVSMCLLVVSYSLPTGNPLDNIMAIIQSTSVSKMCPDACAKFCAAKAAVCIDIPEVMDCVASSRVCNASCDALCGCYATCDTSCAEKENCDGKTGAEAIECMIKNQVCLKACHIKCPVDGFTKEAKAGLEMVSSQLNVRLNQAKSMLSGNNPSL